MINNIAVDDRIPSHVFRFVERELYDYPVNRELVIDYLRLRNEELTRSRQAPESMKIDGVYQVVDTGGSNSNISDPTLQKSIRLLALSARAERALFYVQAIDSVLPRLTEEERRLVQRKYFDNCQLTNNAIAAELCMSRTRFYEVRENVIRKFALRFALL